MKALGETKEVTVGLDRVEIDGLAPVGEVREARDMADRVAAMLSRMIRQAEAA